MATTTPNFGWAVPTSSDLVKNGATAIETLGDAIDASLVDLKGGTTGQVLSKASGTDMDFTWATPSSGASFVGCAATGNFSVTVVSNTAFICPQAAEEYDTNGFHDNSTNNSRITIPSGKAGKYLLTGNFRAIDAFGGYWICFMLKNGSSSITGAPEFSRNGNNGGNSMSTSFSTVVDAAVGDYFEMAAQSDTSGSKSFFTRFTATYLGA